MIRNRLATLLAERSMKITKVANDTGLSRNTITSTAQNDGKMIQLETINTLCQYLNVEPTNFFEFLPFDLDCTVFVNDVKGGYRSNIPVSYVSSVTADLYLKQHSFGPLADNTFDFEVSLQKEYEEPFYGPAPDPFSNDDIDEPEPQEMHFTISIASTMSDVNKQKFTEIWTKTLSPGFQKDIEAKMMATAASEIRDAIASNDNIGLDRSFLGQVRFYFTTHFETQIQSLN